MLLYDTNPESFQITKPIISTFQVRVLKTKMLEMASITYDLIHALEGITFLEYPLRFSIFFFLLPVFMPKIMFCDQHLMEEQFEQLPLERSQQFQGKQHTH